MKEKNKLTFALKNFFSNDDSSKLKEKIFFGFLWGLVILLGVFLRFYNLENIPPGLQYDEAYNGLEGLKAWQTRNFKIFYPENNGREGLYINLVGIAEGFLGVSNFSVRFISALIGSSTLIIFYFLLRKLSFNRYIALLGVFLMSFSFWHLGFSRIVYRAIFVPFFLIISSLFFFEGIKSIQNKNSLKKICFLFALSGIMLGLGFHTYIAFRIAPLIFLIILSFVFILNSRNFFKNYWLPLSVFIITAVLSILPLFVYFLKNPADLTNRSNAISVFNAPNMSFSKAFATSFFAHIFSFFFFGDPNQRHNFNNQPLLPPAWSILMAIGFFISLKIIVNNLIARIRKKKKKSSKFFYASLLSQSIFWIMLTPGILSIEGIPHSLRIIGTIPAVFVFILIPFQYLLKIFQKINSSPERLQLKPLRFKILKISAFGIIFTTLTSGILQSTTYFILWANNQETKIAFEKELFDFGKLIKELPLKENNFAILSPEIYISSDHKKTSLKTSHFSGYPKIDLLQFYYPQEALEKIPCENTLLIFQKEDFELLEKFQKKCPEMKMILKTPQRGNYSFWVMY